MPETVCPYAHNLAHNEFRVSVDKTARHESISHLRSSSLRRQKNKDVVNFVVKFVLNEGRRKKTGYSFMSRSFVRVRIRVRIHKQQDIESITRRHVEQPPVTSNSVCAR